ncbi:VOC family protein [Aliivibrio salmonicida]|uniref:VOC family protein n=1 Tax=Aliivibrio salmonicida TaxID=40269 RepID=UPI003D099E26
MSIGLHHISITCRSLKQSKNFYFKLGFTVEKEYKDSQVSIVMMSSEGGCIELFKFNDVNDALIDKPHSSTPEFLMNVGITHFALAVDDIHHSKGLLEKQCECSQIKEARLGGFYYFFATDPDGNKIEIIKEIKLC